jgi:hypothetical protein
MSYAFQAQFIKQIPALNKTKRKDGKDSIIFGNTSFTTSLYGNTGLDSFGGRWQNNLSFYDIKDVDTVFFQFARAHKKKKR